MKTKLLILLIAFSGITYAQNTWTPKASFGGVARLGAVGFSIGTKGFIGTGYANPGNMVLNDFWEWNPTTNAWTQKANFSGGARGWGTGASIGGQGYLGLGYNLTADTNDFWEYDTTSNSWTPKSLFSGGPTSQTVGFSIGSKVYFLGGAADFWEYNSNTNSWSQKADYPGSGSYSQVGFSIGNKGYIGTGAITSSTYTNDFWEYNPALDLWTQKADFGGTARAAAVGFSIGTKGYVGTGSAGQGGGSNLFKDFWEYNPVNNSWKQKANFGGSARSVAVGFSIGAKGYIGAGWTSTGSSKDFWEYTPDTSSTGMEESFVENSISIFPNPFSKYTTLYSDDFLCDATLTVYNTLGQQVKQIENIRGQTFILQRDNLQTGLYFIHLKENNKNFVTDKFLLITDN